MFRVPVWAVSRRNSILFIFTGHTEEYRLNHLLNWRSNWVSYLHNITAGWKCCHNICANHKQQVIQLQPRPSNVYGWAKLIHVTDSTRFRSWDAKESKNIPQTQSSFKSEFKLVSAKHIVSSSFSRVNAHSLYLMIMMFEQTSHL